MKKLNNVYIDDIITSIEAIISYTNDCESPDELANQHMAVDAVLRRIQVIGEAVKRLDGNLKESYSSIPWKQMAGLRDVVVHDYDMIIIDQIWKVIKDELPAVLDQVRAIQT